MSRACLSVVLAVSFAAPFALGAASGCSNTRLDLRNLEAVAADKYSEESGVAVTAVKCPDQVPTRAGHRFDCTVTFEGDVDLPITFEQTGDMKVRWTARPVKWVKDVEASIARRLAEQGKETFRVSCDQPVYVLRGDTMKCSAGVKRGKLHLFEYSHRNDGEELLRPVAPQIALPEQPPGETPGPAPTAAGAEAGEPASAAPSSPETP